jgi:hypothetical protein
MHGRQVYALAMAGRHERLLWSWKQTGEDGMKTPATKQFKMPVEVHEWIEQAASKINHQASEIERLKKEIADLKAYKKFAAKRFTESDYEGGS